MSGNLPAVTLTKNVFTTVSAPASSVGILAIAACSSAGTELQPGGYSRSDLMVSAFGQGPLVEFAAYDISVANQPVCAVKGHASYPGAYAGLDTSGVTGACVVTATGAPYDHYDAVRVTIVAAGTVGVVGITYTYSLDGLNTSGLQALGAATSIALPNTGITFNLTSATLNAGDMWTVRTSRPKMNDNDVVSAIQVLARSRIPWEGVLCDSSCTTSTVGLVDTLLSNLEAQGIFKYAILNSRFKAEPEPTTEDEATYAAALQATFQNQTSIRVCVGADGAHVPSLVSGTTVKRPTSMFLGARASLITIGEDPAYVGRGPIPGAQIADALGNPKDHDEDLYPNLDSLRLVSLRSFAPGGPQGVYITNANTMQPTGASWPYLQHIRIGNVASSIAWFVLTTQLSRGVRKNPKADAVTGAVTIFEPDAAAIEALVNDALYQPLKGSVSGALFTLSRTDNLNAVPAIVTGTLAVQALAYIKGYQIQFQFVKTIQAPLG